MTARTKKNRKIKTVLRSVKFPKSNKNMCVPNSKETKKKVLLLELILKVGDGKVISQNYLTNIQHLIQML